jgi:hypothetical protein
MDYADSEEDDEKLDTSWLHNFKKVEAVYDAYYKEPVTSIQIFFLYVNRANELIDVDKKHCLLDEVSNLKQERIIELIKESQWRDEVKYKLNSLLRFNMDLNPEEISDFVYEPVEHDRFLSTEKYLKDIHYNPSIPIFHELNALYVLFLEEHTQTHVKINQTKRIKMTVKHKKTMRNKKNLKIKKEIN